MRNVEPSSNASALIIEFRGGNVHIAPIEVIALGAAKLRQFSYFDAQPGQTARRDIGEQENTRVWIEISGAFERCSKVRGNCAGVKIHDGWVSVHAKRSRADRFQGEILSAVSASNVKSARSGVDAAKVLVSGTGSCRRQPFLDDDLPGRHVLSLDMVAMLTL
jgi:hypothetical protein